MAARLLGAAASRGRLRRALRRVLPAAAARRRRGRPLRRGGSRRAGSRARRCPRLAAAALGVFLASASPDRGRALPGARVGRASPRPRARSSLPVPVAGADARRGPGLRSRACRPTRRCPASPRRGSSTTCSAFAIRSGSSSSFPGTSTAPSERAPSRCSTRGLPTSFSAPTCWRSARARAPSESDYLAALDAACAPRYRVAGRVRPAAPARTRASAIREFFVELSKRAAAGRGGAMRLDSRRSRRSSVFRVAPPARPSGRAASTWTARPCDEPGAETPRRTRRSRFHPDRPPAPAGQDAPHGPLRGRRRASSSTSRPACSPCRRRRARRTRCWSRALHYLQHRYGGRPHAGDRPPARQGHVRRARLRAQPRGPPRAPGPLPHPRDRPGVRRPRRGRASRDGGTFDADLVRERGGLRRSVARPGQEGRSRRHALSDARAPRARPPSSRSGPKPGARTRSACTSRRPVTRCSGTASTGNAKLASRGRCSTRAASASPTRARENRVAAESPLPEDFEKILSALRAKKKAARQSRGAGTSRNWTRR